MFISSKSNRSKFHIYFLLLITCFNIKSTFSLPPKHVPQKKSILSSWRGKYDKPNQKIFLSTMLEQTRGGAKDSLVRASKAKEENSKIIFNSSTIKKFTKLTSLMFLCIYMYTNVRDTKDTLVVSHCGAESVPFLKVYGVMPCATLFILAYGAFDLSLLTIMLSFFIFYSIFAFVIYPNQESLHGLIHVGQDATRNTKIQPILLVKYWSFSLYYIISELYASIGVPLFFWTCANHVTTIQQAKQFYPLFAIFGNLAPIASGFVMSRIISKFGNDFQRVLQTLNAIQSFVGIAILWLYKSIYHTHIQEDFNIKANATQKEKRKKSSFEKSSVKELFQNKSLASIATMVLSYNICIELTEVLWKGILKQKYPTPSLYLSFMAQVSQYVGSSAVVLQILSSYLLQTFGWTICALIPPVSMCLFAFGFFYSNVNIALVMGTITNVISKITKYSLFDPCKEMAYIPLDPELKKRGKAAVDVLGSRLGRSFGNLIQQALVLWQGNILACAPYLSVFYFFSVFIWIKSVFILGLIFQNFDLSTTNNVQKS